MTWPLTVLWTMRQRVHGCRAGDQDNWEAQFSLERAMMLVEGSLKHRLILRATRLGKFIFQYA
jgi:hypothetical protein